MKSKQNVKNRVMATLSAFALLCAGVGAGLGFAQNKVSAMAATSMVDQFNKGGGKGLNVSDAGSSGINAIATKGLATDGNAVHGLVPSGTWGDPITIANESYLIYKIALTGGQTLSAVSVNVNAFLWNQNSATAHEENKIEVLWGETQDAFPNSVVRYGHADSTTEKLLNKTVDINEVNGYDTVYLKIDIKQSKANCENAGCSNGAHSCSNPDRDTLATPDGKCGLNSLGVKLYSVSIAWSTDGNTPPVIPDLPTSGEVVSKQSTENFAGGDGTITISDSVKDKSLALLSKGVETVGNPTHGLVPGKWGGTVTVASESYIVYQIKPADGNPISDLSLKVNGKLWGQDNDNCYANNKIEVLIGDTKDDISTPVQTFTCASLTAANAYVDGQFRFDELVQLNDYASGKDTVFIKIALTQYGTSYSLDLLGVKLYSLKFLFDVTEDKSVPVPNVSLTNGLKKEAYISASEVSFLKDGSEFTKFEVIDNKDGKVDHFITMTDPNNVETTLAKNAQGFTPIYEGRYGFVITATDFSGNTYQSNFAIRVKKVNGMPIIAFQTSPDANGRVNKTYTLPAFKLTNATEGDVVTTCTDPNGGSVTVSNGSFTPTKVGEYRIICRASNDKGTYTKMVRIYVKYNTDNVADVYESARVGLGWEGAVSGSNAGVALNKAGGAGFCNYPFPLEKGISITLDVPADRTNFGMTLTEKAGYAHYCGDKAQYKAQNLPNGLYFYFYLQSDGLYYFNMDYYAGGEAGSEIINHKALAAQTFTLGISMVEGNSFLPDNIRLFINGKELIGNDSLKLAVKASGMSDNELFTYVGLSNKDTASAVTMTAIQPNDIIVPHVNFASQLKLEHELNSSYTLPAFSMIDPDLKTGEDKEIEYTVEFYDAVGKTVTFDGTAPVLFDKEGIWTLIIRATDAAGNKAFEVYELKVGNTEKTTEYFNKPVQDTGSGGEETEAGGCAANTLDATVLIGVVAVLFVVVFGRKFVPAVEQNRTKGEKKK